MAHHQAELELLTAFKHVVNIGQRQVAESVVHVLPACLRTPMRMHPMCARARECHSTNAKRRPKLPSEHPPLLPNKKSPSLPSVPPNNTHPNHPPLPQKAHPPPNNTHPSYPKIQPTRQRKRHPRLRKRGPGHGNQVHNRGLRHVICYEVAVSTTNSISEKCVWSRI